MPPFIHCITPHNSTDRTQDGRRAEGLSDAPNRIVAALVAAVDAFARDSGVEHLTIDNPMLDGFFRYSWQPGAAGFGLTGLFPPDHKGYHDGARVPRAVGLGLVRAMLRRDGIWCRLQDGDRFFVHVGEDQQLYVGSTARCDGAIALCRELGLLAEQIGSSPYDRASDRTEVLPPADDAFWTGLAALVAERGGVLLEETYVRNGSRWHRLTPANLDVVRTGLTPRARLAVWPDLTNDIDPILDAMGQFGRLEHLIVQQPDGRIYTRIADPWMASRTDAYGYSHRSDSLALIPLLPAERNPLMTAALPDRDGILRARWRTNPTRADRRRDFLRTVRKGEIRTGKVAATPRFGVFVDLDDDLGRAMGFINIPELSWTHIDAITDAVHVGQEIRFEVLAVDLEREQVALSLKATQEDPWRRYFDTHHVGDIVPGTITRLVPFGAFVRIKPGIEGLVHLTELSTYDVGAPDEVVREDDDVLVLLVEVDFARRRICLSMRQAIET
ncbi:S1 RNA-binding domain-containing protein [Kitasatospora sp. NPDC053057]|uniref:S1 RNA-binding domain-containing protein n=1 Tax=Kitasatospora sp. NPDC053057 TaxID=3364062 RepID=UPI0037C558D9